MNKNWMEETYRFSESYITGVKSFIQFAKDHLGRENIRCPCVKCLNVEIKSLKEVEDHLIIKGISKSYKIWIYHGERESNTENNNREESGNSSVSGDVEVDEIEEMLEDVHRGTFFETSDPFDSNIRESENVGTGSENSFGDLLKEAERELYPNCTKFSTLSFLIKLLHIKVINRWSNKSFDMLLSLLKEAFPIGETLPKSHYDSWRMLRGLGLGYVSIHGCKNDCALFHKEYKDAQECPICGESRWRINDGKGKKIPYKILRYFPLKPRLQRLFMSRKMAADMRWHKEKLTCNANILNHPADSIAWKEFDKEHPWFAEDPRNVRLGLASDGFNPFGNMHNSYSMWPVVLVPYNLPPWKCLKQQFFMMSLLIPGPRAPGKDMDIYLQPLVDELKELWIDGVQTYDASSCNTFQMHAAVMWTINDFPAYGTLSGWSTKGYLACPSCNEETPSRKLRSKICYIGSRRFLDPNHRWRRSKQFDGLPERRSKPKELTGDDVVRQLRNVNESTPGKHHANRKRKRTPNELNWTKKSIFFDLPYWSTLKLRHNLDVMHIEKNICENVLGTLLDIDGKTKDTYKARLDLEDMNIRKELHLIHVGDKYQMPHSCYTLSKMEQKAFCEFLKSVKFPDGYASNISRCANDADGKVLGLKSHDCHVLLQRLLPVGVRGYLQKDVYNVLAELGNFFKDLCCKSLQVDELERLQRDIVIILCKLEMIYPPAFFDVMVHLAIHLPREAILGGPVQYRWMYFIERWIIYTLI